MASLHTHRVTAYGPDGLTATCVISPDAGLTFGQRVAAVTKAVTGFGEFMCEMWEVDEVQVGSAKLKRTVKAVK